MNCHGFNLLWKLARWSRLSISLIKKDWNRSIRDLIPFLSSAPFLHIRGPILRDVDFTSEVWRSTRLAQHDEEVGSRVSLNIQQRYTDAMYLWEDWLQAAELSLTRSDMLYAWLSRLDSPGKGRKTIYLQLLDNLPNLVHSWGYFLASFPNDLVLQLDEVVLGHQKFGRPGFPNLTNAFQGYLIALHQLHKEFPQNGHTPIEAVTYQSDEEEFRGVIRGRTGKEYKVLVEFPWSGQS